MLILVRHADAGDKGRWQGPDEARPLSRKGVAQAAAVARTLVGLGARDLVSSPTLRCVQTLVPSARSVGAPVRTRPELGVRAPVEELLALLDRTADGTVLCTHGEALTRLSEVWQAGGRVAVVGPDRPTGLARTPKGAFWVIEDYHGPRARARFFPASEGPGE